MGLFSLDNNWGGKRKGAGRPIAGNKKAIDNTKVVRVDLKHYARIKSGRYDELMQLLYDYRLDIADNPKAQTSPRYQKLISLMSDVENILGSDFSSWID